MQQALEVLEALHGGCTDSDDETVATITVWCPEVIEALRAALDAPPITVTGLADEMISLGLIDASAIEDPDLYDDARTLQAVEALQKFITGEKS